MPLTFFQPSQVDSTFNGYLRNRIINGAMMIDQRNAGASGTGNGNFTVDRWYYYGSQTSKVTWQQNSGGVTPPVGFTNYLGVVSSSAYSITSTDQFLITQKIEGLNVPDLAWGTASAQPVTLSFWVRSSLTGTFGGSIQNSTALRCYPFSYTISGANTWTYVTVTIPGDTSGTWLTTNGAGVIVNFSLGTGATYSATANAWTGTQFVTSTTGAVSVVGTNAATWYVTGVQLEVGSVATPFERRMYGQELALCQRYYYRITSSGSFTQFAPGVCSSTSAYLFNLPIPVTMRVGPTSMDTSAVANFVAFDGASNNNVTGLTLSYVSQNSVGITGTSSSTLTQTRPAFLESNGAASAYLGFSAEL